MEDKNLLRNRCKNKLEFICKFLFQRREKIILKVEGGKKVYTRDSGSYIKL